MKRFLPALLGLAGLVVASFSARGQTTHPCMPKGIETDPRFPANTEYPTRVNTFNWYDGNGSRMYNINWTVPGNPTIFTPWEQSDNARLTHILGQEDTPSKGWQLIKRDLGYNDQGGAMGAIKNPYVIIYNKYTGILRVFASTGEIAPGYTFAEIKVRFNSAAARKSGTLNRVKGLGVALEDTAPGTGPQFSAITAFQNNFGKWFYADFPMEYDPCTCLFDSKLQVEVNLIDRLDVQLEGYSTGTLMSANTSTGSSFESATQQNSPFSFQNISNTLDTGQKTYNTISGFATGVRDVLNVQGSATRTNPQLKIDALAQLQAALSQSNFLKNGLASLPYIGAAVSALSFFLGGGAQETPAKPIALEPMTIEFSTKTKGTISASRLYVNPTFNNPGTPAPPAIPEEYPYYNEVMGVFSLLRRPTVDVVTTTTAEYDPSGIYLNYTNQYAIKFHDLLHFTVNPASKLRVQDMQAALIMGEQSVDPVNGGNGDFSEFEGMAMAPGATATSAAVQKMEFRTPYSNAACLTGPVYNFTTYDPNYSGWSFGPMYLKIMVNLTQVVPSSTSQNVLVVLKYPVAVNQVVDFPLNVPSCTGPNDVPTPAPLSELQSFCASTQYQNATLMRPAVTKIPALHPASLKARRTDVLSVFPNPAADQTSFRYTVERPGPVSLDVRDALGRIAIVMVKTDHHGTGTFDVAASTSALKSGMYTCTLVTPTYRQTARLSVIH